VSGTPAAASGDPKPANPGAAPTSSTGVETGASSKKQDEYPEERILVVKAIGENHFLTDFVSHVQKPLLAAGFQRCTLNNKVQSWRPFTKRGYPKCTWAMCFGSVEDTNATWPEYEDLRAAVLAQGLRIEKCKPRTKSAPASGVAEHVHNITQHTRDIAEAAAAELAPTDGASARMSEDGMQDIANLIYQRFLKGKNKSGPPE
jgi:hypothetical protein